MTARLLVVDDEQSIRGFLRLLFEEEGYGVSTAGSVHEAREKIGGDDFDLVLCDILMPDGNGLDLLREIRSAQPQTAVIMMTAYTSNKSAIEAMRLGAFSYLSKPFEVEELKVVVEKAIESTGLRTENQYLRQELEERYRFANIIGKSQEMKEVFSLVERVARTTSTVLLQGESGTGKELIARAIHFASRRAKARILSVNCGALPETLLESELFGHEKGAFTGAVGLKKGLFLDANGGTVFLDEIGEMTPSMQVKLLRVLQERRVRKVGSSVEEPVDVRIIAATNQDLAARIADGDFREDLYYRINVIPVSLPPLRRRREDIPLLAEHFLAKYSASMSIEPKPISPAAMRMLEGYRWPGNVRELENVIERALALSTDDALTTADLPRQMVEQDSQPVNSEASLPEEGIDLERYLDSVRGELMRQALGRVGGIQTHAAEMLGMTFRSFRYYAKKLRLTNGSEEEEEEE